jgi:N-formylglutamate amidohydrolase
MAKTPYAIVHIPHSSGVIPEEYREQFVLSDRALEREKRLMTDAFTDEIFAIEDDYVTTVTYPVSRLLVDPERMREDADEPMAAAGMGVLYTHRCDGRPLRRELSPSERKKLLFKYYDRHHRAVAAAAEKAISPGGGNALIIDCHSFPSTPLPCDADQTTPRPDICIGTDPFHTPRWLPESLLRDLKRHRVSYGINRPYSGTFVPRPHYGKNSRVHSIMLEVNRSLYMDEGTGRKKRGFEDCAGMIGEFLDTLVHASDDLWERIREDGKLVAHRDWDSGGPGAGAGRDDVYEYLGEYYVFHDAGCAGPYADKNQAYEENGITWNNSATREIVFLDGEEG